MGRLESRMVVEFCKMDLKPSSWTWELTDFRQIKRRKNYIRTVTLKKKTRYFSCTCKRPQENEDPSNWQKPKCLYIRWTKRSNCEKRVETELFLQGLFVQNTHSLPLAPLIKMFPLKWYGSIFHLKRVLSSAFRKNGAGRAGGGGCGQSILFFHLPFFKCIQLKQSLCPSGIFCHSFNSIGSHIVLTLGHKIHNLYM